MMTTQTVLTLGQETIMTMLKVAGPMLLIALVAGLVISIIQAATQINEMTLSFIPKVLAIFGVLLLTGPWMLQTLIEFTQRVIANIPFLVG